MIKDEKPSYFEGSLKNLTFKGRESWKTSIEGGLPKKGKWDSKLCGKFHWYTRTTMVLTNQTRILWWFISLGGINKILKLFPRSYYTQSLDKSEINVFNWMYLGMPSHTHSFWDFRGHSVIGLLQNDQVLDPLPLACTCSILLRPPANVQNFTSAPPALPISYENRKLCNFIVS